MKNPEVKAVTKFGDGGGGGPCSHQNEDLKGSGRSGKPHSGKTFLKERYSLGKGDSKKYRSSRKMILLAFWARFYKALESKRNERTLEAWWGLSPTSFLV